MIPNSHITDWRRLAPWKENYQVEQDLILSRATVDIFNHPLLQEKLLLRGGTALNKLFLEEPKRYSEDLDLVNLDEDQTAGELIDAVRESLTWLGEDPRREISEQSIKIKYQYEATGPPDMDMTVKIEINNQEFFTVEDPEFKTHGPDNLWFNDQSEVRTYQLDELMGTKMRALFQRKKGRDLFDLWFVQDRRLVSSEQVVDIFLEYMDREDSNITRAMYEKNFHQKKNDAEFMNDVEGLLRPDFKFEFSEASSVVQDIYIPQLPGDKWKNLGESK